MTDDTSTTGTQPGATVTPLAAAKKRTPSRASRAADKAAGKTPAPKPQPPKPTPAKPAATELTHNQKRIVVMNAMIAASAEVIAHWDAKATGVPKDEARDIMANRLSYAGPKCDWPVKILGPRP